MTDTSNGPDLDAIEALREAGTPGPWVTKPHKLRANCRTIQREEYPGAGGTHLAYYLSDADAELIAAAVNALPELVAAARERDRLAATVRTVVDEVDGWGVYESRDTGHVYPADSVRDVVDNLRRALDEAQP